MDQDPFVTVRVFNHPQDAMILRAHLESEGIACFLQDELTLQVNPFYSNAVGGVKLQVRKHDVERAAEILLEAGYQPETPPEPDRLYSFLEHVTASLPILRKLSLGKRLGVLFVSVIVIVSVIVRVLRG